MEEEINLFAPSLPPAGDAAEMHFRVFSRRSRTTYVTSRRRKRRRRVASDRALATTSLTNDAARFKMEKWSRERLSLAVVVVEISFTGLIITSQGRSCDGYAACKTDALRICEISRKWNFVEDLRMKNGEKLAVSSTIMRHPSLYEMILKRRTNLLNSVPLNLIRMNSYYIYNFHNI